MMDTKVFYLTEIECGDFVDFGCYGKLYVTNIFQSCFWVTDVANDRFDRNSCGWSIPKSCAVGIIQKSAMTKGENNETA